MSRNCLNQFININKSLEDLENYAFSKLRKKYFINNYYYGACIINNIIYNEKTHLVARFKDFLIKDDLSEFLKRFYKKKESLIRLPKYYEYYELYSKIFPNYTALKESKYIYKNIHKKQKMIDLQQEMEELDKKKKIEQEEEFDREEIFEINQHNHQRRKNQIDVIFNSDIYNSIIKQSQDLYYFLFGIEKKNCENDSSIIDILEIINLIDNYSIIKFNYNNEDDIIKKNYANKRIKKIIKKNNNSSVFTKHSTINSSNLHKKDNRNFKNLYKKKNDIIIGLKKCGNEKRSITSNSILSSNKDNKNELINNGVKFFPYSKLISMNEKSINKDIKNYKKIKIGLNNQNYISFIKEKLEKINSKYKEIKKGLNENKNISLSNRDSNTYRYQTLYIENSNKFYKENIINENKNKTTKKISKNKILINDGNYTRTHSKNTSIYSKNTSIYNHKKFRTNTITCESERKYKILKIFNKKEVTNKLNNKNIDSLKEIKELMDRKKIKDRNCQTEREYIINSNKQKFVKKLSQKKKSIKSKVFKKFSFKTSNILNEHYSKINEKILHSHKKLSGSNIIERNQNNFSLEKEYLKINKKKIFNLIKDKNNLNEFKNKIVGDSENNEIKEKIENNYIEMVSKENKEYTNLSAMKPIKIKNFSTAVKLGLTNITIIDKKKSNIINNKIKSNTSRNNYLKNKMNGKISKIKAFKLNIEKTPRKNNNTISNNTEKSKKYLIIRTATKPNKK